MAENSVIISSEEEAKLLKPIDEYVEEIQKKIDALRADGFDKVSDLKKQIAIAKENKNLSATQRDKIIENSKKELENAKKVEADNKEEIKKLIAEAESYLAAHYKKDYYDVVNKSCPSLQHFFELERFFGPLSDVVVHMFREAEYNFFHAVLFCYLFNPGQRLTQLIFRFSADNFDSLRSKTQGIAHRDPYCF